MERHYEFPGRIYPIFAVLFGHATYRHSFLQNLCVLSGMIFRDKLPRYNAGTIPTLHSEYPRTTINRTSLNQKTGKIAKKKKSRAKKKKRKEKTRRYGVLIYHPHLIGSLSVLTLTIKLKFSSSPTG
jgi:hypothetical protein